MPAALFFRDAGYDTILFEAPARERRSNWLT
jgi:hypothetical protein